MRNKTILVALYAVCVSAALTIPTAFAQAPTTYKPGDTLSFTVRFDGESINKLTWAQDTLELSSPIHDDQKAFGTAINLSSNAAVSPGAFEASIKIPDFVASGTYTLRRVSTGTQFFNFAYTGDDLPAISITVDNHEHFGKPKLKSIEKTSKP